VKALKQWTAISAVASIPFFLCDCTKPAHVESTDSGAKIESTIVISKKYVPEHTQSAELSLNGTAERFKLVPSKLSDGWTFTISAEQLEGLLNGAHDKVFVATVISKSDSPASQPEIKKSRFTVLIGRDR
jgi:hypothetical protein